jgi:hypothetical protein
MDAIANAAVLSVDNHIGLVFPGQSLCFIDGCFLQPVFGGDALIPLTPNGPIPIIGHYVLVPGPSPFASTDTFKKELHQLGYNIDPTSGIGVLWHLALSKAPKILFSIKAGVRPAQDRWARPP